MKKNSMFYVFVFLLLIALLIPTRIYADPISEQWTNEQMIRVRLKHEFVIPNKKYTPDDFPGVNVKSVYLLEFDYSDDDLMQELVLVLNESGKESIEREQSNALKLDFVQYATLAYDIPFETKPVTFDVKNTIYVGDTFDIHANIPPIYDSNLSLSEIMISISSDKYDAGKDYTPIDFLPSGITSVTKTYGYRFSLKLESADYFNTLNIVEQLSQKDFISSVIVRNQNPRPTAVPNTTWTFSPNNLISIDTNFYTNNDSLIITGSPEEDLKINALKPGILIVKFDYLGATGSLELTILPAPENSKNPPTGDYLVSPLILTFALSFILLIGILINKKLRQN